MKNISLLTFILLSIYSMSGQQPSVDTYQINQMKSQLMTSYDYKKNNNLVNGSPYLNDDFLDGNLYLNDSLIKSNISLRYNIYNDQIEIKDPKINKNGAYGALIKDADMKIKILLKNFKYYPGFINPSDQSAGSYLEILEDEKPYILLKKYEVTFQPKVEARSQYEPEKKAEFEQKIYYYILDNDSEFIEIPNRKSKLYDSFSEHSKKLKSFIKKSRIDLDNERDIFRVVKYLNALEK